MRKAMRGVEAPAVLFHGTSIRRVEDWICCEGLRPQRSAPGVYLTDSLDHAIGYADYAVDLDGDRHGPDDENGPAILVVDMARLKTDALGPDDYELADAIARGDDRLKRYGSWKDVPWNVSLEACEQVTYADRIPWDAVRLARSVEEARSLAEEMTSSDVVPFR